MVEVINLVLYTFGAMNHQQPGIPQTDGITCTSYKSLEDAVNARPGINTGRLAIVFPHPRANDVEEVCRTYAKIHRAGYILMSDGRIILPEN